MGHLGIIAVGGALGAVARYLVTLGALRLFGPAFPVGTLAVNVAGSFLMGVLAAFLLASPQRGGPWALFLMTGFLGAFTTFSAFSLDVFRLIEAGAVLRAAVYAAASVGLSVTALVAGVMLARAASA